MPFGVLLSGGLDSSLVASLAARAGAVPDRAKLLTFSVGLEGSPDLAAARTVAAERGTDHREFTFTVQEGLDALADVVGRLETYDVTTIRAGTPMYLLARRIKALGVKMVLSGEGADEAFGGYLYFHKAPSAAELHAECVRKVRALHSFDCLRANKATMAWGLEVRVPFLDRDFLDTAMSLDPMQLIKPRGDAALPAAGPTARRSTAATRSRRPRCAARSTSTTTRSASTAAAAATRGAPYLPSEVLWRQRSSSRTASGTRGSTG